MAIRLADQLLVQRLGNSGRRRWWSVEAIGRQLVRREKHFAEPRAERQDGDGAALLDPGIMRPLPISKATPWAGQGNAGAIRRADSGMALGPIVDGDAAVATMWVSSASSAAAMTTKFGRVAR